jgi:hypothetical protein
MIRQQLILQARTLQCCRDRAAMLCRTLITCLRLYPSHVQLEFKLRLLKTCMTRSKDHSEDDHSNLWTDIISSLDFLAELNRTGTFMTNFDIHEES